MKKRNTGRSIVLLSEMDGKRPRLKPHLIRNPFLIKNEDIRAARFVLDRVAEPIDAIQRQLDKSPGPRFGLQVRGLIVGGILAALAKSDLHLTVICRILRELPSDVRKEFGVENDMGQLVDYDQVRRLHKRVAEVMSMWDAQAFGDSRGFVGYFTDLLIDASIDDELPRTTSAAVDSTDVPTWAAVQFLEQNESKDVGDDGVDESISRRRVQWTKDHGASQGHAPAKKGRRAGVMWGYDVHICTQVRELNGPEVPQLIVGLSVVSGNHHRGDATVGMLAALARRGQLTHVIVDKGYSGLKAESFIRRLREAGILLTQELYPWQRKPRKPFYGRYKGFILQDGWLFCPSMPAEHLKLESFRNGMSLKEQDAWAATYDERANYAASLEKGTKSTGNGSIWVSCPARRGGHVRCPLVPESLRRGMENPTIEPPANFADHACCSQGMVKIEQEVAETERQEFLYGVTNWLKSKRRRAAVESSNSLMKLHYGRLGANGHIRLFELINHQILLAMAVAATNIQISRSWRRRRRLPPAPYDEGTGIVEQQTMEEAG